MSIPVLILGEPGSGKSSSMRNFEYGEVGVFQTIRKMLPFRNKLEVAASRDFDRIASWLNNDTKHKAIVCDDFGYLITDIYMRYSYGPEKKSDQYEVFKIIAAKTYNLLVALTEDGRDDRIVYLMMHIERTQFGDIEPSTLGKMVNEKIKIMGMVTIMLQAISRGNKYQFITNGEPFKSPPGMFDLEIDNDLKFVDTRIREYWGMAPLTEVDADE